MRRAAFALAVVLLVAGCSGLVPSSSAPGASPTQTPTAAPVPTDSPTQTPGFHPILGGSQSSVASVFDVAARHKAILANTSYRRTLNETTRYPNGSVRLHRTRVSIVEAENDTGRYLVREQFEGPFRPGYARSPRIGEEVTYVDEQVNVAVTYDNGTTAYQVYPRHDSSGPEILALLFSGFETRLNGSTGCGTATCYRVESATLADSQFVSRVVLPNPDWTVTNASLVAYVDQRGVVRRYRVRYHAETPTSSFTGVRRVQYTHFGRAAVEEPAWVEQANAGTAAAGSYSSKNSLTRRWVSSS